MSETTPSPAAWQPPRADQLARATTTGTEAATTAAPATVLRETAAGKLASIPIWLFVQNGVLRLTEESLSFSTRSSTVFDAPLHELHSLGRNAFGMTVWHGTTRHRFTFGKAPSARLYSGNPALVVSALPSTVRNQRMATGDAYTWLLDLQPLVGVPPAGLAVPKPWPAWRVWTTITLGIAGGLAVIVGLSLLGKAIG